jgi:hypothetical protein
MPDKPFEPFVRFSNLRDILAELETDRVRVIATRIDEVIERGKTAGSGKIDGLAAYDKKDGGKDCGTDGKEGKENSEGKETCDPDGSIVIYGDPANLDFDRMATLRTVKAARLERLLTKETPVI